MKSSWNAPPTLEDTLTVSVLLWFDEETLV